MSEATKLNQNCHVETGNRLLASVNNFSSHFIPGGKIKVSVTSLSPIQSNSSPLFGHVSGSVPGDRRLSLVECVDTECRLRGLLSGRHLGRRILSSLRLLI